MVVTFTAGGSSDVLARAVADAMSRGFGKQVAVDNGPAGHVGAESVAHAAPDGYTILFGTNGTLGIGPALYKNLRYDPERDLAPIGILRQLPLLLISGYEGLKRFEMTEMASWLLREHCRRDHGSTGATPTNVQPRALCGLNNQIEIDCASAINAPKITSGGTSRSDIRGIRRNVVRHSYNNGASRPARWRANRLRISP